MTELYEMTQTPTVKQVNLHGAQEAVHEITRASHFVHRLNYDNFYVDHDTGQPKPMTPDALARMICLMHSELSEMMEGVRKNTMDSHIPTRRTEEVELADLVIRALDYAGYRCLDLSGAIRDKLAYNCSRADHTAEERRKAHGKKF